MRILLDTNFVLTCAKQKIDFVSLADEMFDEKIEWVVVEEVLDELKELSKRKGGKIKDKNAAGVGLDILEGLEAEKIKVSNKNVDIGIMNYIRGKGIILATLDRSLKKKVDNRILSIRGDTGLVLI